MTTPHFVVRSDFDEPAITAAAVELEATRDELISAAWPAYSFPETVRTSVYILSSRAEFEHWVGPWIGGVFEGGSHPVFVLSGRPGDWGSSSGYVDGGGSPVSSATSFPLRHELAHQLSAVVYPRRPQWFSEGLAAFLETTHRTRDGTAVVLGEVNRDALSKWKANATVSVRDILEWDERPKEIVNDKTPALHGKSWWFVNWLFNIRREAFASYQVELARGVEPKRAWARAHPIRIDGSTSHRRKCESARQAPARFLVLVRWLAKVPF